MRHSVSPLPLIKLSALLATVLALSLPAVAASAMTMYKANVTCPIGGEQFTQDMAGSGTATGAYLDSKPIGPTPAPWPLPKCPGNGFVMFQAEYTPEELEKLSPFVLSAQYKALQAKETPHYLAARLMGVLNLPKGRIAYSLVQASWEAQDSKVARRYRTLALENYVAALAEPYEQAERWTSDQLIAGELERRLGKFKEARTRFQMLTASNRLNNPVLVRIAEYQLELIAKSDTQEHKVPEITK